MSLHLPSREVWRSVSSVLSTSNYPRTRATPSFIYQPRRNASIWDRFKRERKPESLPATLNVEELMKGHKPPQDYKPQLGKLEGDSIFGLEDVKEGQDQQPARVIPPPDARALSAALNPRPWVEARWQRKKVIQSIQRRGRLSKTEQILKRERFHMHGSSFFQSSMKKLVPIARQIAGKSIEDALIQLRFSKKLAAKRIAAELRIARDEAIVAQGMGLGHIKETINSDGQAMSTELSEEKQVPLKEANGKVRMVKPTSMYIDQAWVNKGKATHSVEYRARGQRNILTHPHTMISFLLKEEKTRLRLAKEKEQKKADAKPWLHHPDKTITTQRQHIMW